MAYDLTQYDPMFADSEDEDYDCKDSQLMPPPSWLPTHSKTDNKPNGETVMENNQSLSGRFFHASVNFSVKV